MPKMIKSVFFLSSLKLRGPFQLFASTFFSTMDSMGEDHKMPSFEEFSDRLNRGQANLI